MREAWLGGVVLLLLLSHVSRLFTLSRFEATPTRDGIRGVDFNQARFAVLATLPLQSRRVLWG